jgi:spore coat protein CotH
MFVPLRDTLLGAALLSFLSGCGGDDARKEGNPSPGEEPRLTADEYRAASAPLFDVSRRFSVEVDMEPADWEALGSQGATLATAGCQTEGPVEPLPDYYDYFPASVTIDGTEIQNVGVRKKGFLGSLSMSRPSLKVSFDEYSPGEEAFGLERLTLNNGRQDDSRIRQCVAYHLFGLAGVPSPRCSFASVSVNGTDLGSYVHVEGVTRRFLRLHFEDDTGNLYEGQGADFEAERLVLFQLKTNEATADRSHLQAMTDALKSSDADLLAALAPLIDVDRFLTYWAMESLAGSWDTYSTLRNNFFVYDDPATGFHFIPWGPDASLSEDALFPGDPRPQSISASSKLSSRLFALPAVRERYIARMRKLLDEVWDEAALLAYIDQLAEVLPDERAEDVEGIREFVRRRRQVIEAELEAGPVPLPTTQFCFEAQGPVTASFSTVWQENADTAFSSPGATAALDLAIDGTPVPTDSLSAVAGELAASGAPGPSVRLGRIGTDGKLFVVQLAMEPALYGRPEVPFHALSNVGFVLSVDLATAAANVLGFVSDGKVTFEQAGRAPGEPVVGNVSGVFYRAHR